MTDHLKKQFSLLEPFNFKLLELIDCNSQQPINASF